ncbi:hypothetical protein BDQ17DRAFT_1246564, partial [Cyathus striatus]
ISLIVACFSIAVYGYTHRKTLPLPPGPNRYPIIGSLLSMPKTFQWETFMQWGEKTGSDVLYAESVVVKLIVLNSVEVANDLLTRRSRIYSSRYVMSFKTDLHGPYRDVACCRPQCPMIIDLRVYSTDFQFSLLPYGEKWRARRRLFQRHFPVTRHGHYQPLIKQFFITFMTGGFALALGYRIRIKPFNDPYVSFSKETLGIGTRASVPGRYLVDVIPLLKHVLEWMPFKALKC